MKRSSVRLSNAVVEALEASDREYHVWDRDLIGFGVRVHPSGSKSFVVQGRTKRGRAWKKRIGTFGLWNTDQARTSAKELLWGGQQAPQHKAIPAVPFERLVDEWLSGPAKHHRKTHVARGAQSIENDRRNLAFHVLPLLRGKFVDEIARQDIEAVRNLAEKKRSRPEGQERGGRGFRGELGGLYAAGRTIRTLKSVFAYAEDRGYISSNPTKGVRVAPDQKREVFLTGEELKSVHDLLNEAQTRGENAKSLDIIRLWYLVGCRRSEIEQLRWCNVDLDRRLLRLPKTKTGPKEKYLSPLAVDIIARQPRIAENPYVFPGDVQRETYHQNAKKVWARLRAGRWPRVRPHDFRHTFASQLAEQGVGLHAIRDLIGHASIRSTERYAHLTKDHLHSAVSLIEEPFQTKPAAKG